MPVLATTTTTYALKALAPLIGSAGLAGFLFTGMQALLFTKGTTTTQDFLKLDISAQRIVLKEVLMQLHPVVPATEMQLHFNSHEMQLRMQLKCSGSDNHSSRFHADICEVCLEEVDHTKISLTYAPCGHRCVCDDCDRDIIVIKLSSCVNQHTIAGDAPLHIAVKQLLDPKQLASTFPRTDRCVKCNTAAQRQYANIVKEQL